MIRQFENLTPVNGFDESNLVNARQNNYAWSMSDLDDFIYIGTGRNILYNIIKSFEPQTQLPALINPGVVDNGAEIWRYRKDGSLPWKRVYKANNITGFRYMIRHKPLNGSPALYTAGFSIPVVRVLKSTNGVNWYEVSNQGLQGSSSRAMLVHLGKIFMSTVNESDLTDDPRLYCSEDPEFFPWQKVIDTQAPGFDPDKNPQGTITNMAVFNGRLYVATANESGVHVWRTENPEPETNRWVKVIDGGFGNPLNRYSLAMGVFKNHLYVSGTKPLPLAWAIPMGCDVVRIDKNDNWQVIVGGHHLFPIPALEAYQGKGMAPIGSGFNNPFNVYAWQIQEYKGRLFITTFDDSSNMEVILTTLLANRQALYQRISQPITDLLIEIYSTVLDILRAVRYPYGFDMYVSEDGVHFKTMFLNGLNNPHNYGGRILYVDSCNDLYLGTANPFQGCEVWKAKDIYCQNLRPCHDNYAELWEAKNLICEHFEVIMKHMPAIRELIPQIDVCLF
jgi:hypothetical protein